MASGSGGKLLLVAIALALAIAAFLQVFVALQQKTAPQLVLGISGGNAAANARMGDLLFASIDPAEDPAMLVDQIEPYSRRSFQAQGLNVPALRQMGLLAALRNDLDRAEEIFATVRRMSKRDFLTSMYQHELAYASGNLPQAASYLDDAARTSRLARETLMPRAVAFLEDPDWRGAIAQELSQGPDWDDAFWQAALARQEMSAPTAELRTMLPGDAGLVSENVTRLVMHNAIRDGHVDEAVAVFRHVAGTEAANRQMRSNISFAKGDWPPFHWETFLGSDTLATPVDNGRALEFSILPSAQAGLLARRLIRLRPGVYTVDLQAELSARVPENMASLAVTCGYDNRVLARVDLAGSGSKTWRESFSVTEDCPMHWLRVESGSNPTQRNLGGRIDRLEVHQVG
ncbi:hypothetical protein SAMN06297468_1325 [Altererythrobacter xiamenensis]|uniref:Tetratricopeptide repeat-containing protein n=2 Tax=Altererythrobacter xiamenensis TaxID=1316679 RepID=A0A1Y6F2K9_9SPHN|nr:hypothetical protein SAMN06297468_1325 [Altererythrobacter xiamenensis]